MIGNVGKRVERKTSENKKKKNRKGNRFEIFYQRVKNFYFIKSRKVSLFIKLSSNTILNFKTSFFFDKNRKKWKKLNIQMKGREGRGKGMKNRRKNEITYDSWVLNGYQLTFGCWALKSKQRGVFRLYTLVFSTNSTFWQSILIQWPNLVSWWRQNFVLQGPTHLFDGLEYDKMR